MCTLSPNPQPQRRNNCSGTVAFATLIRSTAIKRIINLLSIIIVTRAEPLVTSTVHSYHVDNGRPTIGAWWPFAGARSRGLCGLPPSYQTLLPASPIRCFALSRTVIL